MEEKKKLKKTEQCTTFSSQTETDRINTDPNGSWTGVETDDPYEKPVQDVDDL